MRHRTSFKLNNIEIIMIIQPYISVSTTCRADISVCCYMTRHKTNIAQRIVFAHVIDKPFGESTHQEKQLYRLSLI